MRYKDASSDGQNNSGMGVLSMAKRKGTLELEQTGESPVSLRPPLKWAGGKRWLVPHLQPFWRLHSHRRLVEPFCGGLAVTLGLLPKRALLNDINLHLINFYRWLQEGLEITLKMSNQSKLYYSYRMQFNELIRKGCAESKLAAEFFYFLNRTTYNGLCRFNGSGEFNVPFGKYKNIAYKSDFMIYRSTLSRWEFEANDFENLKLRNDDFIYADPPYDVEFTHYAKEDFRWEDQERLAKWLSRHPGPVILSNQATSRILKLYGSLGFTLQTLPAPRRISCNGDRTPAKEVVATRNI